MGQHCGGRGARRCGGQNPSSEGSARLQPVNELPEQKLPRRMATSLPVRALVHSTGSKGTRQELHWTGISPMAHCSKLEHSHHHNQQYIRPRSRSRFQPQAPPRNEISLARQRGSQVGRERHVRFPIRDQQRPNNQSGQHGRC